MKDQVQEIDLIALIIKCYSFIKKHFFLLAISGLIGGLIGCAIYFITPSKFEQEIIGYSPIVNNQIIVECLSELTDNEYKKKFSDSLNNLEKIKEIKTEPIENPGHEMLKITFISHSPISVDSLKSIVIYSLADNDYINNKMDFNSKKLSNIIKFFDKEIELKREQTNTENSNVFINNQETPSTLFIEKNKYQEELAFLEPFIVTKSSKISKVLKSSIIILFITGAFLGIILIFGFFAIKKINLAALNQKPNK